MMKDVFGLGQGNTLMMEFNQNWPVNDHAMLFQEIYDHGKFIGFEGNNRFRRFFKRPAGKSFTQKDAIISRCKDKKLVLISRYLYRRAFMVAERSSPGGHIIVLIGMPDNSFFN